MSFEYRDRVNRDKPKLSERFRGKSGQEIAEELRKDFAKRKQMFFDTSPRTRDFMKPGFPFDDTTRWRNRGDSDLRHRLDEIAQRYPQFADQLSDWTSEEESPSGMGWGSKQTQSQPSTPQQTAAQAPQRESASTTQQPQQQPPPAQPTGSEGGDVRTQRAMSAPPDNRPKDQPQRFVSRLEINPNSASGEAAQQAQEPPQPGNQQQPPQQPSQPQSQQQTSQPEPKKKPSNVRHIPIFVEGRNETVMPRDDVDTSTAEFGKSFGSPPRERDSRDREDGFHGPAYAKYAPPGFGFMNKPWHPFNQRSSPFMTRDTMHGSPPQHQQHFPQQQHHPHHSQPHHPQPHHPQPHHPQPHHPQPHHSQPHHSQPHPQAHPQPQHPPQQQAPQPQQAHPETVRQETPPRQPPPPPKPKDPLEVVAAVQKDVDELMKQVEAFTGTRRDKQYVYLDEMLTRNLLKLDLVETEGKENVRAARKETIKSIQKGISILESKTMTPEEIAARAKAMEVDPEPAEVEAMEVSTEAEGAPTATQTPGPTDESVQSAESAEAAPSPVLASSTTPVAAAASEPTPTAAPAPASEAPAPPMEPMSTESKDSNTSSTVNPEAPVQPETTVTPPVSNPPAETVGPAAAS